MATEETELLSELSRASKDDARRIAEKKATLNFTEDLPFKEEFDVDENGNIIPLKAKEPTPGETPSAFERQADEIAAAPDVSWRSDGASHGYTEPDKAA